MINQVTLVGNLGDNAELRTTQSGTPYTYARLATNENYKDRQGNWQKSTEWHSIKIWGNSSNRAAQVLVKGKKVYVQGQLKSHQNQEGKRFWEVRVDTWFVLDKEDKKEDQFLPPEPSYSHNPSPFGEGFTRR
jgi:single-strand DNA-binding protein